MVDESEKFISKGWRPWILVFFEAISAIFIIFLFSTSLQDHKLTKTSTLGIFLLLTVLSNFILKFETGKLTPSRKLGHQVFSCFFGTAIFFALDSIYTVISTFFVIILTIVILIPQFIVVTKFSYSDLGGIRKPFINFQIIDVLKIALIQLVGILILLIVLAEYPMVLLLSLVIYFLFVYLMVKREKKPQLTLSKREYDRLLRGKLENGRRDHFKLAPIQEASNLPISEVYIDPEALSIKKTGTRIPTRKEINQNIQNELDAKSQGTTLDERLRKLKIKTAKFSKSPPMRMLPKSEFWGRDFEAEAKFKQLGFGLRALGYIIGAVIGFILGAVIIPLLIHLDFFDRILEAMIQNFLTNLQNNMEEDGVVTFGEYLGAAIFAPFVIVLIVLIWLIVVIVFCIVLYTIINMIRVWLINYATKNIMQIKRTRGQKVLVFFIYGLLFPILFIAILGLLYGIYGMDTIADWMQTAVDNEMSNPSGTTPSFATAVGYAVSILCNQAFIISSLIIQFIVLKIDWDHGQIIYKKTTFPVVSNDNQAPNSISKEDKPKPADLDSKPGESEDWTAEIEKDMAEKYNVGKSKKEIKKKEKELMQKEKRYRIKEQIGLNYLSLLIAALMAFAIPVTIAIILNHTALPLRWNYLYYQIFTENKELKLSFAVVYSPDYDGFIVGFKNDQYLCPFILFLSLIAGISIVLVPRFNLWNLSRIWISKKTNFFPIYERGTNSKNKSWSNIAWVIYPFLLNYLVDILVTIDPSINNPGRHLFYYFLDLFNISNGPQFGDFLVIWFIGMNVLIHFIIIAIINAWASFFDWYFGYRKTIKPNYGRRYASPIKSQTVNKFELPKQPIFSKEDLLQENPELTEKEIEVYLSTRISNFDIIEITEGKFTKCQEIA